MNTEIQQALAFIDRYPLLFLAILVWSFAWKGVALWKAAQRDQKGWFVALLLINTFGILEIIYYYFVGNSDHEITEDDSDGVEYLDDTKNS